MERGMTDAQRMVTVCDVCHRASCWHGVDLCDDAQMAGTVEVPVALLDQWGYENPKHYSVERVREVCGGD